MITTINGEPYFVSVTYTGRFMVTSYWRPEQYQEMMKFVFESLKANIEYQKYHRQHIVTAADIKPMTPAQRKRCRARIHAFCEALKRCFEPKPEPKDEITLKTYKYEKLQANRIDQMLPRAQARPLRGVPPHWSGTRPSQRHGGQHRILGRQCARSRP